LKLWKLPDQVVRLAILFVIAIAALIAARAHFVPPTFGEKGHFRAAALDAARELPVHFAGLPACVQCHDDVGATKAASYHRGLSCETCHGPAADHVEAPDEVAPVIPRGRPPCLRCHEYRISRPTGFPQVVPESHNPGTACTRCHDPHDPTPPELPSTCSACHRTIASQKEVSHHRRLECTTCHQVPERHRIDPRAYRPTKPASRSFCGRCHAPEATGIPEAPRIDMSEHGGRYLCWQCHYPHHPEG